MDLKSIEEVKATKPRENNELKSKTAPTLIEGTEIKGNKCIFPKNAFRNRSKTTDWVHLKDYNGHRSNIPQSLTLIRSKSCDKNSKTGNILQKIDEKEEKKYIKTKCTYEKYKAVALNDNMEKKSEPTVSNVPVTVHPAAEKEEVQVKKSKEDLSVQCKEYRGFTQLLPLCEKELRKIEDTWLSSVYCSMSSRANLVKLLNQEIPPIDLAQFQTETEKLLNGLEEVKISNKTEAENLLKLVKSLLASREKAKEEIAQITGTCNDSKKVMEPEEENKLKMDSKKKENSDAKKGGFLSFFSFGHNEVNNQISSKQKETSSKNQSSTNAPETKNDKSETVNITIVQKEFDELKRKYSIQNEAHERKVKDLEKLFEEKCKILARQKEMKAQLRACLNQFQAQQKRLSNSLGCERLEFLLGRSFYSRSKRREEVWLTAIRLIVKGFLIQIKNLEAERNKMLYQLQSDDIENLSPLAIAIIQRENFFDTVKQQMRSFHKAYKKISTENNENKKN